MKKKPNKIVMFAISLILAMELIICVFALGVRFLTKYSFLWNILAIICLSLLVITIIVVQVVAGRFKKSIMGLSMQELYNKQLSMKEDIEKDYDKAEERIQKDIHLIKVYQIILSFITVLLCLFSGGSKKGSIMIIGMMSAVFLVIILCCSFLVTNTDQMPDEKLRLSCDQYPVLYQIADSAAKEVGCKKKIYLQISGDGICVFEFKNCVVINLNYIVSYLTKVELYNIMLHEFAHVINEDTSKARKAENYLAKINGNDDMPIINLFFSYFKLRFEFDYGTYRLFSSRYREICADAVVKKCGEPQEFINATAKTAFWYIFKDTPCPEIQYNLYESEQPPKDVATNEYNIFLKYLEKYGEKWKGVLKVELPARVDSHPILRQRMENMEITTYDETHKETDENYINEGQKIKEKLDLLVFEQMKLYYEAARKENYLDRKKAMEEYDAAIVDGKELDEMTLLKSCEAFYSIDTEKSENIARELLKKNSNSAYAHFYLGCILFDKLDKECVEHFYASTSNYNFTNAAMDYIGKFALRTGDQQLLDSYREKVIDYTQTAFDRDKNVLYSRNQELTKNDIPEETSKEIINYIIEKCGEGHIDSIYSVKKHEEGKELVYYYILKLRHVKEPMTSEIYSSIFEYLDKRSDPWNYALSLASSLNPIYKAAKKVDGALIYKRTK